MQSFSKPLSIESTRAEHDLGLFCLLTCLMALYRFENDPLFTCGISLTSICKWTREQLQAWEDRDTLFV